MNNKIFTKNIFKNNSKRKRNFMIYHFLVESKLYERIDLLITANVNIFTRKNKEKKQCYLSEGKLMKQFGTLPPFFLREAPLSTLTPLFLSKFFMTAPLCPNFKNMKPPLMGEETMFTQRQ